MKLTQQRNRKQNEQHQTTHHRNGNRRREYVIDFRCIINHFQHLRGMK